jgi:hypothetical protein
MRSPRVILGAVALVATAVLAGCGDGDSEVSTGSTTTSTSSPATTTTSGGGSCAVPGATIDPKNSTVQAAPPVALLTDVRTGRQPCADRVVFDFENQAPGFTVQYQPGPFTFGESGEPVTIEGSAFLVVQLAPASGFDLSQPDAPQTYSGPDRITPGGLTHVREIRRLSDFEANQLWVIGLDSTRPFTVATLTGPSRVYLDIG